MYTQVTVIDTSHENWWKGKCLGRVGFFPSKYCARLSAGEKPLQVMQNLQLSDGKDHSDGIFTLLRDQIVVQVYSILLVCQAIVKPSLIDWFCVARNV